MIVQVPYFVRVWAHVDTESGEVVKVVEDLESIVLDDEGTMLDENYEPTPWKHEAEKIAEADANWPAWDR